MFLSEYLAFCETNKYEVLSYLMRHIVFVGKSMRTSFLEEILPFTDVVPTFTISWCLKNLWPTTRLAKRLLPGNS